MTLRLGQWGNSMAIRLPQGLLKKAGLEGEGAFEATALDRQIILKAPEKPPTLESLFEGWGGGPPEGFDWGEPAGRELL